MSEARQFYIDKFYFAHKPCCAGCDWWKHINSVAGTCERHAPTIEGFPTTTREQVCGDFKDEFDWESLPRSYLKKIGYPEVGIFPQP